MSNPTPTKVFASGYVQSTGNLTGGSFTVATAVAAGDTIVVLIGERHPSGTTYITGVSDSRGNSYTLDGNPSGSTVPSMFALSTLTTALQVGDTVSFTMSGNTTNEYVGEAYSLPGTWVIDGAAPAWSAKTSSTAHSQSVTPPTSTDLVIGADIESGGITTAGSASVTNATKLDEYDGTNREITSFYTYPNSTAALSITVTWDTSHISSMIAVPMKQTIAPGNPPQNWTATPSSTQSFAGPSPSRSRTYPASPGPRESFAQPGTAVAGKTYQVPPAHENFVARIPTRTRTTTISASHSEAFGVPAAPGSGSPQAISVTGIGSTSATGTPTAAFVGSATIVAVPANAQARVIPPTNLIMGGDVYVAALPLLTNSSLPAPTLFLSNASTANVTPSGIPSSQAVGTFSSGVTTSTPVTVVSFPMLANSSVPGNGFVLTEFDQGGQGALVENSSMPAPHMVVKAAKIIKPVFPQNTTSMRPPTVDRAQIVVLRPIIAQNSSRLPLPSILTTSGQTSSLQAPPATEEVGMSSPRILYSRPAKITAAVAQVTDSVKAPVVVRARKSIVKPPPKQVTSSVRPATVNIKASFIIPAVAAMSNSTMHLASTHQVKATTTKAIPAKDTSSVIGVLAHTAHVMRPVSPPALEKVRANGVALQTFQPGSVHVGAPSGQTTATLASPVVQTQLFGSHTAVEAVAINGTIDITGFGSITIDGPPAVNVTAVANTDGSYTISRDITLIVGSPWVAWQIGNPRISKD